MMREKGLLSANDFDSAETARRRDEVVRRMANTPPQPQVSFHPKKKTKAGVGSAARKSREAREA
jgi:hypothetical protein